MQYLKTIVGLWIASSLLLGCQMSAFDQIQQLTAEAEGDVLNGAALVMQGEEVMHEGANGWANYEQQEANTVDTRFRLASLTKLFTQAAVLRLVDQGMIDFDAPVATYRPAFQPHIAQRMTVREVFGMTAGLPRELDSDMSKSGVQFDEAGMAGPFLDALEPLQLVADPDSAVYNYSNVGYWVLGSIVEAVTEQTFPEAVESLIFAPLAMHNSGFEGVANESLGLALGYERQGDGALQRVPPVNIRARYASGGGYSTVNDLKNFSLAFQDIGFLSEPSRLIMLGRRGTDEGAASADPLELNAGGVLPGFTNRLLYQPEGQQLVILLNNVSIAPPTALATVGDNMMRSIGGKVAESGGKKRVFISVPHNGFPDTPLAQAMKAFTEAIAMEDAAQIEAVFRSVIVPSEFTEEEIVELGENMAALPQEMGKWDVAGYREESPLQFEVVVFGEEEREVFFVFSTTEETPDRVKDLFIRLDGF